MHLTPREQEKLMVAFAADLARKRASPAVPDWGRSRFWRGTCSRKLRLPGTSFMHSLEVRHDSAG